MKQGRRDYECVFFIFQTVKRWPSMNSDGKIRHPQVFKPPSPPPSLSPFHTSHPHPRFPSLPSIHLIHIQDSHPAPVPPSTFMTVPSLNNNRKVQHTQVLKSLSPPSSLSPFHPHPRLPSSSKDSIYLQDFQPAAVNPLIHIQIPGFGRNQMIL